MELWRPGVIVWVYVLYWVGSTTYSSAPDGTIAFQMRFRSPKRPSAETGPMIGLKRDRLCVECEHTSSLSARFAVLNTILRL